MYNMVTQSITPKKFRNELSAGLAMRHLLVAWPSVLVTAFLNFVVVIRDMIQKNWLCWYDTNQSEHPHEGQNQFSFCILSINKFALANVKRISIKLLSNSTLSLIRPFKALFLYIWWWSMAVPTANQKFRSFWNPKYTSVKYIYHPEHVFGLLNKR